MSHLDRGLYADYLDRSGLINDDAWRHAVAIHAIVGTCRAKQGAGCCDGFLKALPPTDIGRHRWYEAECMRCRHIVAAPAGKTLLRSGRASEQPPAMAGRREQWKKLAELAKGGDAVA